jgi:hypothetical protein
MKAKEENQASQNTYGQGRNAREIPDTLKTELTEAKKIIQKPEV